QQASTEAATANVTVDGNRVQPREAGAAMQDNQDIAGQFCIDGGDQEGAMLAVDPAAETAATQSIGFKRLFFQRFKCIEVTAADGADNDVIRLCCSVFFFSVCHELLVPQALECKT